MQRNFLHSTHLLFPNEYTKKSMFEDYNLEKLYCGNSIVQGYPRNTIFFNQKSAQEIRKKYKFNDCRQLHICLHGRGVRAMLLI